MIWRSTDLAFAPTFLQKRRACGNNHNPDPFVFWRVLSHTTISGTQSQQTMGSCYPILQMRMSLLTGAKPSSLTCLGETGNIYIGPTRKWSFRGTHRSNSKTSHFSERNGKGGLADCSLDLQQCLGSPCPGLVLGCHAGRQEQKTRSLLWDIQGSWTSNPRPKQQPYCRKHMGQG